MASSHDYSHELAGNMGLGLLTLVMATPPDEVARRIEIYDEAAKQPESVSPAAANNRKAIFYMAHCAETDKEARANAERSFLSYVAGAARNQARLKRLTEGTADAPTGPGVADGSESGDVTLDWLLDNRTAICGSPETCIRQIEEITKTVKVDELMLLQQFWAMPHEQTMKSIELFGKHIIPHFAKKAAVQGA